MRKAALLALGVGLAWPAAGPAAQQAAELFAPVASVLTHARCVNCHPATATPRQGDARRPHVPRVVRGPDGHGLGQRCQSCHGETNNAESGVPGSREWFLAPASMAWEGLDAGALCRVLLDVTANGGRDLQALAEHLAADPRVDWAWSPGPGRALPPLSKADFLAAFRRWADAGATCPR